MAARRPRKREQVVIIGAGGHGGELHSYIEEMVAWGERVDLVGFVDEGKPRGPLGGTEILGDFDDLRALASLRPDSTVRYITAVGDNRVRRDLVRRVEAFGIGNLKAWTLRHPRATVGCQVEIGDGSCLTPGTIVTTRVRIGRHCILNVNASVSHDCVIEDFVNINPGAAVCGNVRIGEGCYLGAGATVIDGVSVGRWTIVGAGAVVLEDLPDNVTAVGVPARIIKHSGPLTI